MKEYKTPVVTDIALGEVLVDNEEHTVVGVVPFIAAILGAAASVAGAGLQVAQAAKTYNDNYMSTHNISTLDEVE